LVLPSSKLAAIAVEENRITEIETVTAFMNLKEGSVALSVANRILATYQHVKMLPDFIALF
jgi:hypothetical protein